MPPTAANRRKQIAAQKAAEKARREKILKSPVFRGILLVFAVGVLLTAGGFSYAANQEEHDTFCASCHTQPETTFFERSTAAAAVDLASFHTLKNTRCIDCHSGAGLTGRISAEMMGAHNAFLWYTNQAVQPATATQPVGDGNCLKCHAEVLSQNATRNNHFHVFLPRWQGADPNAADCTTCHQGHKTSSTTENKFLDVATVQVVCESCHRALGEGE